MAREKGTGNLQQEKGGRWTIRIGINGRRLSRATGTTDRAKAERCLERYLSPLGLGAARLPLAEAWHHYEMSPNRRDIARMTLKAKRQVWMDFARWMELHHGEIAHLAEVTEEAVAEYLAQFRCRHAATTYNNHVCALREMFRVLAERAGMSNDPWANVCLRADDSVSRRELTLDELGRLYAAASKEGPQWKLLVVTGIYTGLRLGDCCRLKWENVDLDRQVIQVVPEKTKRHRHGRPVTIPVHPALKDILSQVPQSAREEFVNPTIARAYMDRNWEVDEGLRRIFKAANITMSVRLEGRSRKSVVASFHSLRHTFVSLSANAGVPLPVVQSIVGHCSTAMTRHYYHENEDVLRRAVAAIPAIGLDMTHQPEAPRPAVSSDIPPAAPVRQGSIAARLKRLDRLFAQGVVSEAEYAATRLRILSDL
ncbi:MAG: site-specific integrase [Kiritimatiellae bacterium]|nr:site-specific integrase [Kiritimatiellia bacterium]